MNFLNQFTRAARYYSKRIGMFITSTSAGIGKPDIWKLCDLLIQTYKMYIPQMRTRSSLDSMDHEEKLYAVFSHASYRYISDKPIRRINEFTLHPEYSDENSVVYMNGERLGVVTRIVISFRGTNPKKLDDILTDVFLTFGREHQTERFKMAVEKIEKIRDKHPFVPIVVCGHSLGGAQAIHLSKRYNLPSYTYNPAQGISETYLKDINRFPRIRVYRVVNDPVSCIAGLENVRGITLFPVVSNISMIKNHSLNNFLPETEIPEEVDIV